MPCRQTTTCIHETVKAPKALVAGHSVAPQDPFPELAPERRVDPMILWGAWPGEEPVKLLMEELSVASPLPEDWRAKASKI